MCIRDRSYALVILPLLGGWAPAAHAFASDAMPIIAVAALLGTVSYLSLIHI